MQSGQTKADVQGRKAKLARSYQELLDEFSNKDLTSVGNYTLGRFIGKGSFGKVYLATHKLTNGSKVVLKSARKDDENLAREIHHHRQFVHPHIARLYEVVVTESMAWLVLEYCPGDELYNYLLKHGKLSIDKVQRTFTQLVGAVSYVHQQSCVHRDLKLENILLDKHESVKLVDFGFTREYEGKANYLTTFCGTICYSAPEMLKGEKYAGEKVDVWSLGVILYALLCGELPFDDDDDAVTRKKILTEEPKYPDHIPPDALSLLKLLLSKRPLLRPSLPDILNHAFLAEHAPLQQDILKRQRPPPFSAPLEQETLQRMRSAGVDTDAVVESVLAQRCDALAGWWTLLIEKEERKHRRREQKRREKEAEHRLSRRFSQGSSRLEKLATVGEEAGASSQNLVVGSEPLPRTRGRAERRSGHYPSLTITDFPMLAEPGKLANGSNFSPDTDVPPPPIDKDSVRSASSSRHRRPIPPPKEGVLRSARSRGSTLHLVTTSEVLAVDADTDEKEPTKRVKRKPSQLILAHWKNWTQWIVDNTTRRRKHHGRRGSQSAPDLAHETAAGGGRSPRDGSGKGKNSPRPQKGKYSAGTAAPAPATPGATPTSSIGGLKSALANGHVREAGDSQAAAVANGGPRSSSASVARSTASNLPVGAAAAAAALPQLRMQTSTGHHRQSLSPSPLTPRSTMRRSSGPAGLRGRKSTSSSVSSIRSMHISAHHQHSHSKASSTSSNGSVSTSLSKTPSALQVVTRSPHHSSVKVLPATPTATTFPSNIRLVRNTGQAPPPLSIFNEGMPAYHNNGRYDATSSSSAGRSPGSPSPFGSFSSVLPPGPTGSGGGGGGGGVMFAKRKRNLFKGPMLSLGGRGGADNRSTGSGGGGSHSRSASASGLAGRRSGEITIQEEEEEDEEGVYDEGDGAAARRGQGQEYIEEVEVFSPLISAPGEIVEEQIFEEGDEVHAGQGEDTGGAPTPVTVKGVEAAAASHSG